MIQFRHATSTDLPVLNKISIESKKYWRYPEDWIDNWLDELTLTPENIEEYSILVARHNSIIIGFCAIIENTENYEILHLWISPEFIGKGYGKQLLNRTLEKFIVHDKPIHVESDPNAEQFYKKQGFETFDRIKSYPPGRYLPVMKKPAANNG